MAKHLHPIVYIVADKPAKDNLSAQVPLVGTASYRTLLSWLGKIHVDVSRVRFFNQSDKPFSNPLSHMTLKQAAESDQIKVIALGKKAHSYLSMLEIGHFELPHPSGLNRVNNSKRKLNSKLKECQGYIYGTKTQGQNQTPAEQGGTKPEEVQPEASS